MHQLIFNESLKYWQSLSKDNNLPILNDIDSIDKKIKSDNIFILRQTYSGIIRFHYAGVAISNLLGMGLCTMPAYSLINIDNRNVFKTILDQVLTLPAVAHLSLASEIIRAKMLLLPLKDKKSTFPYILGVFPYQINIKKVPMRFGIYKYKIRHITTANLSIFSQYSQLAEFPQANNFLTKRKKYRKRVIDGNKNTTTKDKAALKRRRSNLRLIKK